jgi:hypothetical protein
MRTLLGIGALLVLIWVAVMVVGILGRLVLWVTRPGWSRFVDAWERTFVQGGASVLKADHVRPASEISEQERQAMLAVYTLWVKAGKPKPIGRWLEEWAKGADDRPWRVQEGGNEAEGFAVVGYSPYSDQVLKDMPNLYGPYATLEDAQAVVAAKDPSVRPLSEELLEKEREEMMKWREEQSGERPSGGHPPTGRDD